MSSGLSFFSLTVVLAVFSITLKNFTDDDDDVGTVVLLQSGTLRVWKANTVGHLTPAPLSTCQVSGVLTHVILNTCNLIPDAASP